MSKPEPASRQFTRGPLAGLFRHCRRLQSLDVRLRRLLAEPIADHVRVANYKDGELVLQADSPAWRSRLRFAVPGLERALRDTLDDLRRIRVTTRPQAPPRTLPVPKSKGERTISPRSSAALRALARSPGTDPRLARALEHLARLAKDRDGRR